MGDNKRIVEAYMNMILDGMAFSNWKNPPDRYTRRRIVEHLMEIKRKSSF